MALYGVGLDVNVNRIILEFRLFISRKNGGLYLRQLQSIFNNLEGGNNGVLNSEDFSKGLNQLGFFLKKTDYQTLEKQYNGGNGTVLYYNFLKDVRIPLSKRRQKLIEKTYSIVDKNQNSSLSYEEIANAFDASKIPSVANGKKSKEQALNEVINDLDQDRDGKVVLEEWLAYFEDLSVSIPSDLGFIDLIQTQWGVTEDEDVELAAKEVKQIIKQLRYKLIQMTSGSHEEFLIRKIFKEYDVNQNGTLNQDELYAMSIKLEVPIQKKYLVAIVQQFDKNRSGKIEFEEFLFFLINDPYQ